MKIMITALAVAALAGVPAMAIEQGPAAKQGGTTPPGELILYEMTDFNGDTTMIEEARSTVHTDWNIRSISVHPGDRWQICARPRYQECIILDRSVRDAHMIGVEGQIGSARPAPAATPAPAPAQPH
jgi:hypothetical protein